MTILVCGSLAFDNIMVFHDKFKNHIMPDQIHILNVSFLVPTMRKEYGGCAGNISYNLKLLGADVIPMATVGQDFTPYAEWLINNDIKQNAIKLLENNYTGQAFITTDEDDNQITAFHPGAMGESHQNHVSDVSGIEIGIVSPDGKEGMIQHAQEFADANIPFLFDPGQGLPMFDADELKAFINQATWLAVNDYESKLIQDKTGWSLEKISKKVEAIFVTKGHTGSVIYHDDSTINIPVCKADNPTDPTGCGDAYRAGLLYGLVNDLDLKTTGQIASLLGAIKVEKNGTQNHKFTKSEFEKRYFSQFKQQINL